MSKLNNNTQSPKIEFSDNIQRRNFSGKVWTVVFQFSTLVGIIALGTLLINVINQSSGYVHYEAKVDPDTLTVDGLPLEDQSKEQLMSVLQSNLSSGAYNKLDRTKPFSERDRGEVYDLVFDRIVKYKVEETWQLWDSLTKSEEIKASLPVEESGTELRFVMWANWDFLRRQQSSDPVLAGVRTAILGSLWTISITILVAFPLGVMAAIYLEEYAADNWFNRIIQTNINNLAGVPSIIYGILGLTIFVRVLEPFTSGTLFGAADPTTANGRTIMSAGLTLALLVLPLIIINSQEAIRAVPGSLRNASYGIGATKWQTVWSHVLPNAVPGILTGTILAVSRAIGETAPLVVIGASTVIFFDPENAFSKFTTLPIQIYQWTSRPQEEFQFLAAAAIIVLLIILLSLNATAILLRNRFSRRY
ncbi:MAG TPA: phosphate ABC transporter permease PstA [Anaerolineales bacterium]|nr:phosphate ABC transporter permease PstA [Anaerolineales bacterium]